MPENKASKYVPGEEVIFRIRPSFFVLAGQLLPIILMVFAFFFIFYFTGLGYWWVYVLVFLAGVFIGTIIFFNWFYIIYELTNKRVKNRVGIFGSREEEISLDDIQAVDVDQTLWGAIFGFGTVLVKASGTSREVDFTNIATPKKIAGRISDLSIDQNAPSKNNP